MCLSPIDIINPTKYVSLKYPDQYLLQVPCGQCAECQTNIGNQWHFRTWYECEDCLKQGGFVYFDTLTYAPKYLPMLSDTVNIPKCLDMSCFSSRDIRLFVVHLRQLLNREYKGVEFRYFISSEFGSENYTHRPHYHCLFFVFGDIDPLDFSRLISRVWFRGRTDGIDYKSRPYVLGKNVLRGVNALETKLRVCSYVTKYVQKSCLYSSEVASTVNKIVDWLCYNYYPRTCKFTKRALSIAIRRKLNQFHRQSQSFGLSALNDLDLGQLFRDGCFFMPNINNVKIPIAIPTYFKRKLFYNLVEVDGAKSWQRTSLGWLYKQVREKTNIDRLARQFEAVRIQFSLKFDSRDLAEYVFKRRGRICADNIESDIELRYNSTDFYSYNTYSDYEHFGKRGFSSDFLGNSSLGYVDSSVFALSLPAFVSTYLYKDPNKEDLLRVIYEKLAELNDGKQRHYALKQRLTDIFRHQT